MTKLAEIYARRERTLKRRERRKTEKTVTLQWLDGEARVDWGKHPYLDWTGDTSGSFVRVATADKLVKTAHE